MNKIKLSVKYLTQENERLAKLLIEKNDRLQEAREIISEVEYVECDGACECPVCFIDKERGHDPCCKLKLWLDGKP